MQELDTITLARAKRGDRRAIAALVRFYQDRVYAAVGRMLISRPSVIDDAAQETFIKVLRNLDRFETDPADGRQARLSTWIVTIATRTCLDELRRPQRTEPIVVEPADDRSNPEHAAARAQLSERVKAAMADLPPDQRAVLVLRAYHDFDYAEIADAVGVEPGTVKSRLNRARQALRDALKEASDD